MTTTTTDDSRARRLYPDFDETWGGPGDYTPIIESFGEVLVRVDDQDYQGDTRVLLKKGGQYGFLNFGWGSCSGCDALQGCDSFSDIDELIVDLERSIKWFDTLEDTKAYIGNDADRQGSYYFHEKEWTRFKDAVLAYGV